MKLKILTLPILIALTITTASAQYQRTDLVSNQPGIAPVTDPNLVNAWGLVALATSPWWVSDNGTGDSSLFNAMGQPVIGPIDFYLCDIRRYDQRLESRSRHS